MKSKNYIIYPLLLLTVGLISLLGFHIIGAAVLEGAAWKENAIFSLLIIFCLLPQFLKDKRITWLITSFGVAFFLFGGANIFGSISIFLSIAKFLFLILVLWEGYQLFQIYKDNKKYVLLLPLISLGLVILLFPIKDENIIESAISGLTEWSTDRFTSDKGFHIYLGMLGIISSISEFLVLKKQNNFTVFKEDLIAVE